MLGDGYATKKRRTNSARIGLEVKDTEPAVEFSRCLAMVLGRHPIRPRYRKTRKQYDVKVRSETLYQLLKKPVDLDRLKKYVEHCDRCIAAFLRGFFDSEGTVYISGPNPNTAVVKVINTNRELLEYVKELMGRVGIETTGPHLSYPQGKLIVNPRTGEVYRRKKVCYYLYVRARSLLTFYQKVGFTIERKKRRLEEHLWKRGKLPPTP